MQGELYGINVGEGLDVTEQYVGPAAWWVAQRLSRPVTFERGWFRTAATMPRWGVRTGWPSGSGPTATASRPAASAGTAPPSWRRTPWGSQAGWFVRGPTAYEPLVQPVDRFRWLTDWPRWRIAWNAAAALAFAAPLLLGHALEAAILSLMGYSAGSWLMAKLISQPRRRRFRY